MRTAVILLNYRRPQNLPRIVTACLAASHRPDVHVIDNAPDDSLGAELLTLGAAMPDARDRLHYRPNRANRGSGERHELAATLDYDAFLSIDDDIFLTTAQVDALFAAYLGDTSCVHGIWGEGMKLHQGVRYLVNAIHGRETRVLVVNRVYAFGRDQALTACSLLKALGHADWHALGPGSDIILSFSGAQSPMVHDVGPIETCETSGTAGIAYWRDGEFRGRRHALLKRLIEMRRQGIRRMVPGGSVADGDAVRNDVER